MLAARDGYERDWYHCRVHYAEGYRSTMADFHTHDFYEISLILTGNVRSLLKNRSVDGPQCRLVLTAPHTPHWMYLTASGLYSRINLYFSEEFVANYVPEWKRLSAVFGEYGNIVPLSDPQKDLCRDRIIAIEKETDLFRQRLRILELLSYVSEFEGQSETASAEAKPPAHVMEAMTYISEHYPERIVAEKLAWHLGVGRTTLMTSFHKHTGSTLSEYVMRVRVKESVRLLRTGMSQERVAETVGFGNGGGLIRAFRHLYGMTPKQYMKQEKT